MLRGPRPRPGRGALGWGRAGSTTDCTGPSTWQQTSRTSFPRGERVAEESSQRRILLVDCDAFFVQVARIEDPEGAGKARYLIVGGSPTGRGVVTSASYEARAFGVRSAMPTAQALRLCPQATVAPVSRDGVSRKSHEVRDVLKRLAPVVQAASVDEFYLDLSGTERLFARESLEDTARRIREAVLAETDISVSIGGGTRRVIAKLASSRAKPAGVHIVAAGSEQDFLNELDLADLPGVGPALVEALKKRGLVRVKDAVEVQREWLESWLGQRRGAWLWRRVRGVDESEVDPHERRRSVSAERTFFEDLDADRDLERRLLEITSSVGGSLRKRGYRARTITVKLRDSDFKTRTRAKTLPEPVESNAAIHEVAKVLLHELREHRRTPARLLGVGLTGLSEGENREQLGLFAAEPAGGETERDRSVSRVVDQLRDRFGREAVQPGGTLERDERPRR
jgi:DNA polymerase-4